MLRSGKNSYGGRGRNGDHARDGRFWNSKKNAEKSKNKPKGKGLYSNDVFVGAHKEHPVVRDSSTIKAKDMEEVRQTAMTYNNSKLRLAKVRSVIKKEKNKVDTAFIPNFPHQTEYGVEKKAVVTDKNGDVIKDGEGNTLLKIVFIITDPIKKVQIQAKE